MNTRDPQCVLAVCDIARLAGQAILAVYAEGGAVTYKADQSPLTQADLQADAVIRQSLQTQFPGQFIWSEESPSMQADAPCFFLVDPLDGTREFVNRNGEFTVNIAWVEAGRATLGVIHVPVTGELFWAAQGAGAWYQPHPQAQALRLSGGPMPPPGASLRVLSSRSHATGQTQQWLDALPVPHQVVHAGSALKFGRLAQGLADVYPRFGPTCQWDTAAGQVIVEEAGGAVLDPNGQPLTYGLGQPVLNPDFIALANVSLLKGLPWGA